MVDRLLSASTVFGAGLARAGRRRMALLGNSIEGQNSNYQNGTAVGTPFLSGSYAVWANFLSHQRMKLPKNYIFGYPGKTVAEFADPAGTGTGLTGGLAAVLALNPRPGLVILGCFTNNVGKTDGQQTADFIINGGTIGGVTYMGYTQIITALLAAGIKVALRPMAPRGDTTLTAAQLGVMRQVNRWQMERANDTLGVYVPRYTRNLVDPTSAVYAPRAGTLYVGDSLHPNFGNGAYYIGKDIAEIIRQLYPRMDLLSLDSEIYTASSPYGNLLIGGTGNATGQFAGSGGTSSGSSGTTGTIPTGWVVNKASADTSVTVAASVVPSTEDAAFNALQLVYGGSYTPAAASGGQLDMTHFERVIGNVPAASLAVGDVLEGFVGVEWDTGLQNISGISLQVRNGGNSNYNEGANPTLGGIMPSGEAGSGVLTSYEITVGSGDLGSAWYFVPKVFRQADVASATNVAGTIRFTRPWLGKVLAA